MLASSSPIHARRHLYHIFEVGSGGCSFFRSVFSFIPACACTRMEVSTIVLKCADRESFELLRRADRGFCELLLSSAE